MKFTNAKRQLWLATTACAGLALSCAGAQAQSANTTELNLPPVAAIGQDLAAKGIYLNANYFGEFAGNLSGGGHQGSD